jgi:hypothetical protein
MLARIYDYPRFWKFKYSHFYGLGAIRNFMAWLFWTVSRILQSFAYLFITILIGSVIFYVLILSVMIGDVDQISLFFAEADAGIWIVFIGTASLILAVFALSISAFIFKTIARYILRLKYAKFTDSDKRKPILLLRSFQDDHVSLPRAGLVTRFYRGVPPIQRLDHQLVENFSWLAPILALGNPKESDTTPFGAIRKYLELNDEEWLPKVLEQAKEAKAIIIVIDHSAGVREELKVILEDDDLINKTLFLNSPKSNEKGLEQDEILGGRISDTPAGEHVIGYFEHSGQTKSYVAKSAKMDDYMICVGGFFSVITESAND